jgi:PAS domain S-box-containing protein
MSDGDADLERGNESGDARKGLQGVVEAADELLNYPDLDALLRRAVELGREKLGLERCGLFLVDRAADVIRGAYGLDREGRVVDQRAYSCACVDQWIHDSTPLERSQRWVVNHGRLNQWEDGQAVWTGREGWMAITLIRSSRGVVGTFHNDTAWSARPLDPVQQERVDVFCSLLGSIIERQRVEDDLRESERLFRLLAENATDVIGRISAEGRIVYISPSVRALLGYEPQELMGVPVAQLVHPDDLAQGGVFVREPDAAPDIYRREARLLRRDGGHAWLEVVSRRILTPSGEVSEYQFSARNISGRRRAEEALRESEERFRAFMDNTPAMTFIKDASGHYLYFNRTTELLQGVRLDSLRGQTNFDRLPEDVARQLRANDLQVLESEQPGEFLEVIPNAQNEMRFWLTFKFPLRDREGQLNIGGVAIDITERRRAEEALSHYAERLENVLEIDQAIRLARSPQEIADVALGRLCSQLSCVHAAVAVFNFEAHEATVLATRGDREALRAGRSYPLDEVASALSPMRVGDFDALATSLCDLLEGCEQVQRDGDFVFWHRQKEERPHETHRRSLPLIAHGELVGALDLQSCPTHDSTESHWNEDRWTMAREVAGQLAIAIQQARLYEQVRAGQKQLQALSHRLIQAQEAERRHLARELHDEIGQVLTAVKLNLQGAMRLTSLWQLPSPPDATPSASVASTRGSGEVGERLQESIEIVEQALGQVRDLSLNLRPSLLDDLGLAPALRWYVDRLTARSSLSAQLSIDLPPQRLPSEIETASFRVVQEALTNVSRHSGATLVQVEVRSLWGTLDCDQQNAGSRRGEAPAIPMIELVVRDNGQGFDVRQARERAAGSSLGLLGMEERVALVGGRLSIESSVGQGTTLRAVLPVVLDSFQQAAP